MSRAAEIREEDETTNENTENVFKSNAMSDTFFRFVQKSDKSTQQKEWKKKRSKVADD